MDEREEQIARLKQAIKDAKRLQSELKQTVADMDRLLREIHARAPRKCKSRKSD
jgi:type II secretory pathway component PulJ